jgi:Arc-like DNA binding domain
MTRIPEGLRRRLEREAELNRRSMNAEIVHRLEESFQREDQEKMIRRATEEAVKTTAGAAVVMVLSELHLLPPQQPPGKPRLSNEEPARLFADKEEKSNKEEKSK